ncbi:MAG: hypothetical protein KGZ82_10705 [Bacteroidales bacterium]|nr:hypothetical protein [Bacteroidales bacterium]
MADNITTTYSGQAAEVLYKHTGLAMLLNKKIKVKLDSREQATALRTILTAFVSSFKPAPELDVYHQMLVQELLQITEKLRSRGFKPNKKTGLSLSLSAAYALQVTCDNFPFVDSAVYEETLLMNINEQIDKQR